MTNATGVFLEFGVAKGGALVHIGEVGRGKTDLSCPYCAGPLTARKSDKVAAHFAHSGETCRASRARTERFTLPAWDRFDLCLPGRVVKAVRAGVNPWDSAASRHMRLLFDHDLVRINSYVANVTRSSGYEYTRRAEVVRGTLSLRLFAEWQLQTWQQKLEQLQADADRALARGSVDAPDYRMTESYEAADLCLFEAQRERVSALTLYFLRVGGDGLYKIGVTSRPVEERVAEVDADVRKHIGNVPVTVLDAWPGRGRLERYFLYRHAANREPVGPLTEYLRFEDVKPVLRDLRCVRD